MSIILKKAEAFVTNLLTEKLSDDYTFHNLKHTQDTVETAHEIAENSELSKKEIEIIQLAAWFHDTGHTVIYDGHEEKSAEIATALSSKSITRAFAAMLVVSAAAPKTEVIIFLFIPYFPMFEIKFLNHVEMKQYIHQNH